MNKSIKTLFVFILTLLLSLLIVSCTPNNELNLSDLDIDAVDVVEVSVGEYEVPFTIDNLNDYISQYNLNVTVSIIDNDSNTVLVTGNTFSVQAGKIYTVTINILQGEEIIKTKVITVTAVAKVIESIAITTQPAKLSYIEGDYLDFSGMVVTATYNDLSTIVLTGSDYTLSNTSTLIPSDTTITVTHTVSGKTADIIITVAPSDSVSWTVTFNANGGQLISGSETQIIVNHGTAIAPVYTKKDYIFGGFDVAIDNITSDLTATVVWNDISIGTEGLLYNSFDYGYLSYYVEGYIGSSTIVNIPATYNGKPVTSIENVAFNNKTNITKVYISENIKNINASSFNGSNNLEEFIVSSDNSYMQSIDGVIYDKTGKTLMFCPKGKTGILDIESGITSIGYFAFYGCRKLTDIIIPDSVYDIRENALNNTVWYDEKPDGLVYAGKVLYKYKGNMPVNTVMNTILPDTKGIAGEAFATLNNLIDVTIPNGVLYIGNSAFASCNGLTDIIIPVSVIRIDNNAFKGCVNLTDIYIPDTLNNIGSQSFDNTLWYNNQPNGMVYIGKVAYNYKGSMPANTTIALNEGTIAIADYAFYTYEGLLNLVSVYIPQSVKRIGGFAFSSCTGITMLQIPDSVDEIADYAFAYTVMDIYAEASSKPIGWSIIWNPDPRPVIWNCGTGFITFTFNTNEGEEIDPIEAVFLSYLPVPIKTGWTLVGWHLLQDLTDLAVTSPFYPETKDDTTLYAEWEISKYTVEFLVEGYNVSDEGDGIIQLIEHGSSIVNAPVITHPDYTFISWDTSLNNITEAMTIRPVFAGLLVDSGEATQDYVVVSAYCNNDLCVIKIDKGNGYYSTYYLGDSFDVNNNKIIKARCSFNGGEEIDLVDLVIDNIDRTKPSAPVFEFRRTGTEITIHILSGQDRGTSGVDYNEYRVGELGDWIEFDEIATRVLPNNTLIAARTYDNAGNVSSINERYIKVDIIELEDHLLSDIQRFIITEEIDLGSNGTNNIISLSASYIEAAEEYQKYVNCYVDGDYKGCGLYAAQIFISWFGMQYTQSAVSEYVETTDFGKYIEWLTEDTWADPSIFTTPAQLDNGLQDILNLKYDSFEVVRSSPNSSATAIAMIEDYLSHGYPVAILVNDGEHWQIISESDVIRNNSGDITSASFLVHDAGGAKYRTWSQLDYFFEDNWSAELAREMDYTSYIDTIMSIRYVDDLYTVQEEDWSSGWSEAEFFTVDDNQYLFLLKESDGTVHINEVDSDGIIGDIVYSDNWTSGWDDVSFYYDDIYTYLVLYKSSNELINIRKMTSEGEIGELTYNSSFPSGENIETANVRAVMLDGVAYISTVSYRDQLGYSSNNIYEVNGGVLGDRIDIRNSSSNSPFTYSTTFEAYGNSYVINVDPYRSDNTNIVIYQLNPEGLEEAYGLKVDTANWSDGWTNVIPYQVGEEVYLFVSKAGILDEEGVMANEYGICAIHHIIKEMKTVQDEDEFGNLIDEFYEIEVISIGHKVDSAYWPPYDTLFVSYGYNIVRFYQNSFGETMLFSLRGSDGTMKVRKITPDGRIMTNIIG